jgi:glycosyltransferase involved in cell wall biosynthesis
MKALVLSNCLLDETQGSGYVIINTCKCLNSLGYAVDLIPPSDFSFLPTLKNRAKIYRMALGMAKWIYKQRRSINNYNLLIFYGAESSIAIYLVKKIFKIDIAILFHSNGIELSAKNNLKKFKALDIDQLSKKWYHFDNSFLFKYCYKTVNAILTVSKYDAEFVKNCLNVDPAKVFFIEPCLPEIYFEIANRISEKKSVITYCGRWTSHKGRISMEFAIPRILKKFPEFIFRIIGVGNDFKVSDYFPEELHDRIEVYTHVNNKEQLLSLYSTTSIFLFPSLTEGFGLVVIEAMINSCAVICGPTGIGGDLKNLDEAIVLTVPGRGEVYTAIETLILDDQLRQRISLNGKKRVEQLHWENFSKKLVHVLDYLLK